MPRPDSVRSEWLAYVGPFTFPWGQPGSRRVYGVARSMAAAGRNVVVAGGGSGPATPTRLDDGEGPGTLAHVGTGELPGPTDGPITKAARYFVRFGQRTTEWLDGQPHRPSHVVVYGGGAPYVSHLRKWCRTNGVPLVADVVEWYSPAQFSGGPLGPAYLGAQVALRHHYPRCDGIIAISSYLAGHYRRRGCDVVTVPPTLDVLGTDLPECGVRSSDSALQLVYFGTPGRKDLLAQIIRAVHAVDADSGRVRLSVFGPSVAQVRALLGAPLPASTRVCGRIPQEEVPRVVREADFSVLVRAPARFTNAGFPTKFCESLANGTPVIANHTSDLERYLSDGVEGLVCADHSVSAVTAAVRRALVLSAEDRMVMRKAARDRAARSFDVRRYAAALDDFLDRVRG